jgi:hypothetical protein
MKQKKKKIITLEEYLNKKEYYESKYKQSLSENKATENDEKLIDDFKIKSGYYSLKTRILKNPWVQSRPSNNAIRWLFKEVFKDPRTYKYQRSILYQGGLFMFEYLNPKYKDTSVLPWFDQYPLVISLGPIVTKQGIRNIGFNLHLLPPKIRIIVLCKIFELYKRLYRYQIYYKIEKPVNIHYKDIILALQKYGVKFAVRMYIPKRTRKIIRFPMMTWYKAIFIPSRGYYGIKAQKLIEAWKKFCRKNEYTISENTDWKRII